MLINIKRVGVKQKSPGCFQWFPAGTKRSPGSSIEGGRSGGGKEGSCTAGISSHAEVEMLHHPIPKRSCVLSAGMAGRGTGEPCLLQGKAQGEASPHTPPIHTLLPWRCPPSLAPSGEENQSSGLRTRPYRPNPPAGTERLKRVAKKRRTASNAATTARSTASILSAGTARPAATTEPGERGEAEGEGGGAALGTFRSAPPRAGWRRLRRRAGPRWRGCGWLSLL